MNSLPEVSVYIPVESYCATNLLCPDLPFAENGALKNRNWLKKFSIVHLKTGNWLKKFSIVHLKNRKLLKEIFYCIAKIKIYFDSFFYRVLKKQETN